MRAGAYQAEECGITGEAFTVSTRPEQVGHEMTGDVRSYLGSVPMLRAARFGQVLTTNDPNWSEFYWEQVTEECAYRFGCHYGLGESARQDETVGVMLLGQGLYQSGDQEIRVGRDLRAGDTVISQHRSDMKQIKRSRRSALAAMEK